MKFLGKTSYALFIVLLLAVAGIFLASLLPIPGNIKVKIVKSGSMEPSIQTGSLVVIKPETDYKVGDVITFGEDTRTAIPTTHRIFGISEKDGGTYYTTKGDANDEPDPEATARKDVIGRVLVSVPYAGFILDFAKKPIGFALLIGLPAALIIIDELFIVWREMKIILAKRRKKGVEPTESESPPTLRERSGKIFNDIKPPRKFG